VRAHASRSAEGAPIELDEIVAHLDTYLRVAEVGDADRAFNGLQVENDGTVRRVAVAVDACLASITGAAELGADLLVVHHGLFWDDLGAIVGRHGRRVRALVRHGIALYAAHIPLDLHPEVGNNSVLARQLGLADRTSFGEYRGSLIGVAGRVALSRDEFVARVSTVLGVQPRVVAGGADRVERVGIVTGRGVDFMRDAHRVGLDTFLTGEGTHHTYFDAEELGMNLIYAGHYATETVGVKALGAHVHERFGIPWRFIDHPTGY
jgi:dinuclear metal center YbgI/SA1388 family protein